MSRSHQINFFMKSERLAPLLMETLEGWQGAVVVRRAHFLPLRYDIIEVPRLEHFLIEERGTDFFLSLKGVPRDPTDLRYTSRTPGHHVQVRIGRIEPARRFINSNVAIVDNEEKPALGLLATLRKAIARVSKYGVVTVMRSGEEKINPMYWTPDLIDWDLGTFRALRDGEAANKH